MKPEDAWLGQHYPGCTKVGRALPNEHGRFHDAMEITAVSHATTKGHFDITKSQDALSRMFLKSNQPPRRMPANRVRRLAQAPGARNACCNTRSRFS